MNLFWTKYIDIVEYGGKYIHTCVSESNADAVEAAKRYCAKHCYEIIGQSDLKGYILTIVVRAKSN